jgi:uncharacterized Tic20 family protein
MTADTGHGEFYHPSQDERTLACISHLTIFVSSIGLLIAIGLWIYLRTRHPYAAFQAAQAALYQFFIMILTFVMIVGVLIVFFGAFGIGLAVGGDPDETAFAIFLVLAMVVFFAVIGILALVLYIYAIYAAIRSYQGRPFRIPGVATIAQAINPMPPVHPEGSSGR